MPEMWVPERRSARGCGLEENGRTKPNEKNGFITLSNLRI